MKQHTEVAHLRQLRIGRFTLLVALAVTLPARLVSQEPQRVVRQLAFEGNHALDDYTLSGFIATSASGWMARFFLVSWLGFGEKRYLNEGELRRDVVRLVLVYRQSGYMAAQVDTVVRRDRENAFVKFVITEGEPVRVTAVAVTGLDSVFDSASLRKDLPLQVGDPFNRFLFQASVDTILLRLRRLGYPYAQVLRSFDANANERTATVSFEGVSGPRMRIGAIAIEGLDRIDTGTVEKMLPVRTGQVYGEHRLFRAQRDLYDLGVFRYADVILVDSLPPTDPADSTVDLIVRVEEGRRRRVRVGVGYGTEECFRTQGSVGVADFLGGGRALEITGRVGMLGVGVPADWGMRDNVCGQMDRDVPDFTNDTLTYYAGVTVRQPAFLRQPHVLTLSLFAERRAEPHAYVRTSIGGNLGATFYARGRTPVALTYGYSLGSTAAEASVYCSVFQACTLADQQFLRERRPFAGLVFTAARRRVDSPLDPSQGTTASATFMHSSPLLGSDPFFEFNRTEGELAWYKRVGRRSVLAWRVWAGAVIPRIIQLTADTSRFIPPEHRLYAGGPNTVRGYSPNALGPLVYVTRDTLQFDTTTTGDTVYSDLRASPTGGSSGAVANVELRVPSPVFANRMQLTFFVDVGQVWDEPNPFFALGDLRVTPGVGMRFVTPLGPVRVDFGYNGYQPQAGPLMFETDSTIVRIRDNYQLPRRANVLDRIQVQIAVGPTF